MRSTAINKYKKQNKTMVFQLFGITHSRARNQELVMWDISGAWNIFG